MSRLTNTVKSTVTNTVKNAVKNTVKNAVKNAVKTTVKHDVHAVEPDPRSRVFGWVSRAIAAPGLSAAAVLAVLGSSSSASAQTLPVPSRGAQVELGLVSLGPPSVSVDVAPGVDFFGSDLVFGARVDTHARQLRLNAGAQLRQDVSSWFFVREAVRAGPVVGVVDGWNGVDVGVVGEGVVEAGFVVGPVVIVVGPGVSAAAVVDGAVSARVTPQVVGGAAVSIVDGVFVVVDGSGGYDIGGVGEGAVVGSAFAGVQFRF